jgi:hypothetical protein
MTATKKESKPRERTKKTADKKNGQIGGAGFKATDRDRLQELETIVPALNQKIRELKARVAELEAIHPQERSPNGKKRWTRGVLPGEKYIKTEAGTGRVKHISREEWDRLG